MLPTTAVVPLCRVLVWSLFPRWGGGGDDGVYLGVRGGIQHHLVPSSHSPGGGAGTSGVPGLEKVLLEYLEKEGGESQVLLEYLENR